MKLQASIHECPHCHFTPESDEYPVTFIREGKSVKCGSCFADVDPAMFRELEVPAHMVPLIKGLIAGHMVAIERIDPDSGIGQPADDCVSNEQTIWFKHRVKHISGLICWFEISAPRKPFVPHNADFDALRRFAPLAHQITQAFLDDGYVVSECPGKEGRGLRYAGIRLLKYCSAKVGQKTRHFCARAFITWDFTRP